jgi:RNA polymerase sigma-70 factor (ECF subfamily)
LQEQELIEQLKLCDERAYHALFTQYGDMVYRLCRRFLDSHEEAEDATQEVFCKVFVSICNFRADAKLSSWMYRMTLNHCLNVRRQKQRIRWLSLDWLNDHFSESPAAPASPAQIAEINEEEAILHAAIDELSETQRTALLLYRFEGLSYQEIAEILDCSISAVESRLFQAKKNLCKKLIPLLKDTSFSD